MIITHKRFQFYFCNTHTRIYAYAYTQTHHKNKIEIIILSTPQKQPNHKIHCMTMEKRINQTIEEFIVKFKQDIRHGIANEHFEDSHKDKIVNILEQINEYPHLILKREDIMKPKRVKPEINTQCRCNAKRANNEQCTRRKKDGSEFCGTHIKGTPNGLYNENVSTAPNTYKVEVSAVEIQGIVYYIDDRENVYSPEDVLSQKSNPTVIAKYQKNGDVYSIPELGLIQA